MTPGAAPTNVTDIPAIAVNDVQVIAQLALAPGAYRAFIRPGEAPAQSFNDSIIFTVGATTSSDLKVLPVALIAGTAEVQVKNVGDGPAAAGNDLMLQKVGAAAVANQGPIGGLSPGATKSFSFAVPPGVYKAFISPGDPSANAANDFANFTVAAESPTPSLPPKFGALTLKTGFLPAPFTKTLTAGGALKTNLGGVNTNISKAPDFKLTFIAGSLPLTFKVASAGDTTPVAAALIITESK
jgi:hypothetical protein